MSQAHKHVLMLHLYRWLNSTLMGPTRSRATQDRAKSRSQRQGQLAFRQKLPPRIGIIEQEAVVELRRKPPQCVIFGELACCRAFLRGS